MAQQYRVLTALREGQSTDYHSHQAAHKHLDFSTKGPDAPFWSPCTSTYTHRNKIQSFKIRIMSQIKDTNPLSTIWFASIFLPSAICFLFC